MIDVAAAGVVLFSLTEMFSDFNFILKIFVLLTVINFAKNHIGNGPIAIVVVLGMAYFVFSDLWILFGGAFLLYTMFMFGIGAVLIDIFFVGSMGTAPAGGPDPFSPISSGADVQGRMAAMAGRGIVNRPPAPNMPMGR